MQDALVLAVKKFLQENYGAKQTLILGFSGGPDSLALLYLILECAHFFPGMQIHLAHIDHGWREESAEEARKLQSLARALDLPFHLKKLSDKDFGSGNKEERARDLRLDFFAEVYKKIQATALLLAHQQDDLAETVLKRIFEGAGLFSWDAMQPVSELRGMRLWRPLLNIKKKQLVHWLHAHGHTNYVQDRTNLDPKFLRGRMRSALLPQLEESFGKNVVSSLCALAEDASVAKMSLKAKFSPIYSNVRRCLWGEYFEAGDLEALHPIEYPLFLKGFFKERGLLASRELLQNISTSLLSGSSSLHLLGHAKVHTDRERLFLITRPLPEWSSLALKEGKGQIGTCRFEILWEDARESAQTSDWRDVLNGRFIAYLPAGNYNLQSFSSLNKDKMKDFLLKRYSSAKVPAFMRSLFPFVINNDELIHEFMTGKNILKAPDNDLKRLSITVFPGDK